MAVEKSAAEPAELFEEIEGDGDGAGEAEGFFDLQEMQLEGGELAGGAEPGFDGGPVDLIGGIVAGEAEQIVHASEWGPDAVGVFVADLGMDDQMGD